MTVMSGSPKEAAMLPDSTQSGNVRPKRKNGKKRKKKEPSRRKKKVKDGKLKDEKSATDGGPLSDLDLTKPLFPISHYISDREDMLQQAFESVSKEQIDAMMPDVLKECPMEVVKALCLGQLEGMSKKRILHVLAGEEMLSSSDTDESEVDEQPPLDEPQADMGDPLEDDANPEEDPLGVEPEDILNEEPLEPEGSPLEAVDYEPMADGDTQFFEGVEQGSETPPQPELGMSPAYVLDSAEEQQIQAEDPPQKRRKKRKKKPRMIDPVDLEEGEVSEESSEYTDASYEDNNEHGIEGEGAMTEMQEAREEAALPVEGIDKAVQDSTAGELGHEVANEGTLHKSEKAHAVSNVDNVSRSEVAKSLTDNHGEIELPTRKLVSVGRSEPTEIKVGSVLNNANTLEISNSSSESGSKSNGQSPVVCNVVDSNSEQSSNSDFTSIGKTEAREGDAVVNTGQCSDSNPKEYGLKLRVTTAAGITPQNKDETVVDVSDVRPAVFSIPGTIDSTSDSALTPSEGIVLSQISASNSKVDTTPQGTHETVYNVSSSEVEGEQTEGANENFQLGSPNICESKRLSHSDIKTDCDGVVTEDTEGAVNRMSSQSQEIQTSNVAVAQKDQQTEISPEAEGDSLSVNNDSEFDDEESEGEVSKDYKRELPDDQPSLRGSVEESQIGQEGSDQISEGNDSLDGSVEEEGATSDEESSSSDRGEAASAKSPVLEQSSRRQQAETEETANMEPKLNILELELRARAIRSLMKHCAAIEKLT